MASTDQLIDQMTAAGEDTGYYFADLIQKIRAAMVALAAESSGDVSALEAEINKLKTDVTTLTNSIDANTLADLQALADRIAADGDLTASLSTLQGLIETNQTLITQLQSVDTQFQSVTDSLGLRLDSVESIASANQTAISALTTTVTGLQTSLTSLEGRVSATEGDIASLLSDLAGVAVNFKQAIYQGFTNAIGTNSTKVTIGGVEFELGLSSPSAV